MSGASTLVGGDHAERADHLVAAVHGYVVLEMAETSGATRSRVETLDERAHRTVGRR